LEDPVDVGDTVEAGCEVGEVVLIGFDVKMAEDVALVSNVGALPVAVSVPVTVPVSVPNVSVLVSVAVSVPMSVPVSVLVSVPKSVPMVVAVSVPVGNGWAVLKMVP
jgi:hypothetical protein